MFHFLGRYCFENYNIIVTKVIYNTSLLSATTTYSIAIVTITIAFIPLIFMVKGKYFYEKYMAHKKRPFIIICYGTIFYAFVNLTVSIIEMIYPNVFLIDVMLSALLLETLFFVGLTIIVFGFFKQIID